MPGVRKQELLPPDPAGRELHRVQEPDQAGHRRLPRGVLLPAADRQGAPERAQRRADLPVGLPGRGGPDLPAPRPVRRRRATRRASMRDLFGRGPLLARDCRTTVSQSRSRSTRGSVASGARNWGSRWWRPTTATTCCRTTTKPTTCWSASRPARPSTATVGMAYTTAALPQDQRGDGRSCSPGARGGGEHPGGGRALRLHLREAAAAPAGVPGARRATTSTATSRRWPATGSRRGWAELRRERGGRTPAAPARGLPATAGPRDQDRSGRWASPATS